MEYRDVPGLLGVRASDDGTVQTLWLPGNGKWKPKMGETWTSVHVYPHNYGYLRCSINGVEYSIHDLVCRAFHGWKPIDKDQVGHRDGNPRNNKPENLYWCTISENAFDCVEHGTHVYAGKAKVPPELVKYIRGSPEPQLTLAIQLELGEGTIWRVRNHKPPYVD